LNILLFAPPTPDRTDIVAALPAPEDLALLVDSGTQASARLTQGGIDLVILDLAAGPCADCLHRRSPSTGRVV
jgi:hypothetical protein